MKTTLHFEGPSDLSVGTISIHGEGQAIADWVATPGNLNFHTDNIKPGLYATDIGPAGVAPQTVLFEVRAGKHNHVILPQFSTLSASGSNTSYFDTRSLQTFDRLPADLKLDLFERPGLTGASATPSSRKDSSRPERATALMVSTQASRVSIGLSEEISGPESFVKFRSPVVMELFTGRVELNIPNDQLRIPWAAHRVRLSTAIEKVRIERCLLPLYHGGTKITMSTPPFAPSDLEFNITPVDSRARAMLRALDAGTSEEAEAVRRHVVDSRVENDPSAATDPWEAMLLGLLSIRFPQIFQRVDARWAALLATKASWAFDTHVIHASHILAAAREQKTAARHDAVAQVVSLLTKAQVAGSPYYRYTNQLFAEMAEGIASYFNEEQSGISAMAMERFARVRNRWYRELPLQRGGGATFTWLSRDAHVLRERGILAPNRHPSGLLPENRTLVVFKGEVSAGKISLMRGYPTRQRYASGSSEHLDEMNPSKIPVPYGGSIRFRRRPGSKWSEPASDFLPPEEASSNDVLAAKGSLLGTASSTDPNKNQFGGKVRQGEYSLKARFEEADSQKLVTVILTVQADEVSRTSIEDYVYFFLHPTFSPATVKVALRNGRAQLRIQAWGGFTVGVQIPSANVVLECDLAQIAGAPRVIRTR
jgi:hypothetical protein